MKFLTEEQAIQAIRRTQIAIDALKREHKSGPANLTILQAEYNNAAKAELAVIKQYGVQWFIEQGKTK